MTNSNPITYFDVDEDWNMIVADFADIYSTRLFETNNDDMEYAEFISLVYGLLAKEKSTLGNIVRIRSTPSTEYSQLSKAEKEIWLEWRQKHPECITHTKKLTLKDLYGDEDEE